MRTDSRFQGPQTLQAARFGNAALPPWQGQDSQHTDVLQHIRDRDAVRARHHPNLSQRTELTRQHVRDVRHATADISHGRPVDFGIVDQGHSSNLRARQSPSGDASPVRAPEESERAAVTRRMGSDATSTSTTARKEKSLFHRLRPNNDPRKDRER